MRSLPPLALLLASLLASDDLRAQAGAPPRWLAPAAAVVSARPTAHADESPPFRRHDDPEAGRTRRFALLGTLFGGVGAFVVCNAQRPPELTREARTTAAVGCGVFGALLGFGVGVGLAAASDPDRGDARGVPSAPPNVALHLTGRPRRGPSSGQPRPSAGSSRLYGARR